MNALPCIAGMVPKSVHYLSIGDDPVTISQNVPECGKVCRKTPYRGLNGLHRVIEYCQNGRIVINKQKPDAKQQAAGLSV
jgi:hypothetical protein